MFKNYLKVSLNTLLIVACVFFQSCKDPDAVAPQKDETAENNADVLQKIKSLGFADNQIKETPNYYLADGDLYFSKKISDNVAAPAKKTKDPISEKYVTLTIHVDESLASVMDQHWRTGIDQAIAEWNANEKAHFHFVLTNSTSANINIVKDSDLPKDLAIASEFPRDGRTGSSIRINAAATNIVKNPKQAFSHALEHCMGSRHSTSLKNKDVKIKSNSYKSARGPRFDKELYAIQGDILYRINGNTGEYYPVDGGWEGTEVMGQLDGTLYMVQFNTLWAVDPSTGAYDPLTNGWEGSQYITKTTNKLYIMQNGEIFPTDPETGGVWPIIGTYTLAKGMAGFYDTDGKWKLGVLKRKAGSQSVSLLYIIKPSNGSQYSQSKIPASGVDGWNGNFFLVWSVYLKVFNGTLNYIGGGEVAYTWDEWPNVELTTASGNSIFVINSGSLYEVQSEGEYWVSPRRGDKHAWDDTSCLVYLQQ